MVDSTISGEKYCGAVGKTKEKWGTSIFMIFTSFSPNSELGLGTLGLYTSKGAFYRYWWNHIDIKMSWWQNNV